mgnify:CR=1 FL=1
MLQRSNSVFPDSGLFLLRLKQLLSFAHHIRIRALIFQGLLLLLNPRSDKLCGCEGLCADDLNY